MKKLLSKSQANLFMQCPLKWKYIYIDLIESLPSKAQERGINIHKKIEEFYKNPKPDEDLKNFVKFEKKRLEGCNELKYFYPLFQELKLRDEVIGLKGIIDAVYINPKDDGIIVIDWKTGKYYEDNLDDYRFELAVYAELLKHSGKVDEVKYWGIYFTDADKLFFEEIDSEYIRRMYATMDRIREEIEKKEYKPKKNKWCFNCQFKEKCKNETTTTTTK